MTPAEQLSVLRRRAERLEAELSAVILDLDEGAVERLARVALSIGFTSEEIEAVFGPAFRRNVDLVYKIFAAEAAQAAAQMVPETADLADAAASKTLAGLTAEAQKVVDDLVSTATDERWEVEQLARALKQQLPLTAQQNAYVANFEAKLRSDKRLALRNKLRDRRYDRSLHSESELSEEKIAVMVDRYRENWRRSRALGVARFELGRAANASNLAVYEKALTEGRLDPAVRKHWVHMHDDRVRTSHLLIPEMNPDGVPVDGVFVTPLGQLRYPLDPDGEIADVAGCRCSLIFSGLPSV